MNPTETTNIALQAEEIESTALEFNAPPQSDSAPQQPMPKSKRGALSRGGLLIIIALLLAWLGYIVHTSINEINAEVEMIRANNSRPIR